jgi:hypothetical protein
MAGLTPSEFRDALFEAFESYWASRTPIAWPNKQFDPDSIGEADNDAYVKPVIQGIPEGQAMIGASGYFQRTGLIIVNVYTRTGTSTDRAYALADNVLEFFEDPVPDVAEAIFNRLGIQEFPPGEAWFQVSVTANYLYFTDRGA